MSKADLVALSATYSAVITMDQKTRQEHLAAMTRFLDSSPSVRRSGRHRGAHALLLLAGHQTLNGRAATREGMP